MFALSAGNVRSIVVIALCMLIAISCDDSTGPRFGYARVRVLTTGSDPDNLYRVVSDSVDISVSPNAAYVMHLPAGVRTFRLEDVASNCIVDGSNTTSADIVANDTIEVSFKVGCAQTGITVVTQTTGEDIAPAFQLLLSSAASSYSIPANGTLPISPLSPGTYHITLRIGTSSQCSIEGDSVADVEVVNRQMTTVGFNIHCVLVPRRGVIAFVENSTLMVMNADGSEIGALNRGWTPSWSRDGTRIVFSATECDYYAYNCTGSLQIVDPISRQITTLDGTPGGFYPAWSPTDDVIAYADLRNNVNKLILFDLANNSGTVVPLPDPSFAYAPSWSPDGTQIAMTCYLPGSSVRLCIVNRDGSNFRLIPRTQAGDFEFKWSPDGQQFVFTRTSADGSKVAVIDLAGGDARLLTTGIHPSWSPDGKQIIFSNAGLNVINVDGSGLRKLTTGGDYSPAWRR